MPGPEAPATEPDGVRTLLGPRPGAPWTDNLDAVAAAGPLPPFDAAVTGFLAALTRGILADPAMRAHPALMAFAHALRPAAVADLAARHGERRARGTVLHLAPANVDTVFAHSWLLAALCGNAGLVRLSRRRGPGQDLLLARIAAALADPAFTPVRARTLILDQADHGPGPLARLSAACDLRVVWGGDAAVAAVRAVPLPPLAEDLAFPDRFSAALFDAAAVRDADGAALAGLARDFANDVVWFDQSACSSPRLLLWTGDAATTDAARARFWPAVDARVAAMGWRLGPGAVVARLSALDAAAAAGRIGPVDGGTPAGVAGDRLVRVAVAGPLDADRRATHPGLGVLFERRADDVPAALAGFGPKDQTLVVFGMAPASVAAAVDGLGVRTIDRIVPPGRALVFAPVWDGHDLMERFSRRIGRG